MIAVSPSPDSCSSFIGKRTKYTETLSKYCQLYLVTVKSEWNADTPFKNSQWLLNQIHFIEVTIFHENENCDLSIDLIRLRSDGIKIGASDRVIN